MPTVEICGVRGVRVKPTKSKVILALSSLALHLSGAVDRVDAQFSGDVDDQYIERCELLRNQTLEELQRFLAENPEDPCAVIAASLLAGEAVPADRDDTPY